MRRGIVQSLIAALWAALLVVPVGIDAGGVRQVASVGEALTEIASGSLGVGIINALVEGGSLARAAGWRLVLVALAAFAFVLTGSIGRPPVAAEPPKGRRRCPECHRWASTDMIDCPHCGTRLGAD